MQRYGYIYVVADGKYFVYCSRLLSPDPSGAQKAVGSTNSAKSCLWNLLPLVSAAWVVPRSHLMIEGLLKSLSSRRQNLQISRHGAHPSPDEFRVPGESDKQHSMTKFPALKCPSSPDAAFLVYNTITSTRRLHMTTIILTATAAPTQLASIRGRIP